MARIRTIKPEFPHSETIGKLSRDARLLYIQLWTIVDDSGRSRGNSRILASLLYPYDNDAVSLIDGWLMELEQNDCIVRYQAEGATYLQVCNWLKHQKIDKPSASKIPEFDEASRNLAPNSRNLAPDLVPSTYDLVPSTRGNTDVLLANKPDDLLAAPEKIDDCPAEKIIQLWREVLPELPTPEKLTDARRKAIRARWREYPDMRNVDEWRKCFHHIRGSPFLMGKVSSGGREPLVLTVDWFFSPQKFQRFREGYYHRMNRHA